MANRLAIISPPEADCFSFAVACIPAYGAAQRQMKIINFSAIFATRVPAGFCGDGRCTFFFFLDTMKDLKVTQNERDSDQMRLRVMMVFSRELIFTSFCGFVSNTIR